MGAQVLGATTQKIWSTDHANLEYTGITGYVGNNPNAYFVKLGGVVLTGTQSYSIANWTNPDTEQNEGKVILVEAPTTGYELEVRAIQVGAAAMQMAGTLVAPVREVVGLPIGGQLDGEVTLDLSAQQIYLYNEADATSANVVVNMTTADPANGINALISTGTSISATLAVRIGTSVPAITDVQVDGNSQTVKWINTSKTLAPGKLNIISLTVIKTADNVYTVLGSVTSAGVVA
jgi:hypothetical protein